MQRYNFLITRLQANCRGYLIRRLLKNKFQKSYLNNQLETDEKPNEPADYKEFVEKYCREKHKYQFSKKPIKSSITHLTYPEEDASAKAIWLTILRYTGNISEPQKSSVKVSANAQIREILKKITLVNKKNPTTQEVSRRNQNASVFNRLYKEWLETKASHIQKLHFIVGHGIAQPDLRDEIYCQICRILTKNPSKKATHRGWDLLTFCTGCFPPSDILLKYLKAFIRQAPENYISFSLFRLHRTLQNGARTQPPYVTESEAVQRQKPVALEVYLENGTSTIVRIDSATTAKELLDVVAKKVNLTDSFGFSFTLSYEMRRLSLRDGSIFVLDAISECEQYIMEVGGAVENTPWKIHLKKEMFAPWHNFTDRVSNNLIYHQIKEGVKNGEYFLNETDLTSLIAQICYAEHGKLEPFALNQIISYYFPQYVCNLSTTDLERIKEQVKVKYQEMFQRNDKSADSVQADIIKYAAIHSKMQFSRFFTATGSIKTTKCTQPYPQVPLIVGVNSSGVFFIDETNEKCIITKINYMEILDVSRIETTEDQGHILKITNYEGTEIRLVFQSAVDNDLYKLLIKILKTLQNYSKFVISVKNYDSLDETFLSLQKGDLICLSEKHSGKDLIQNSRATGTNARDGKTGNFFLDCVEIIPTMERPPERVIKGVRDTVLQGRRAPIVHFTERLKHYNLEFYSNKYFSSKNEKNSEMWKYDRKKLHRPLHLKLVGKSQEAKSAVEIFENILQYSEQNNGLEVEEQIVGIIFSPGIENGELRDETYCQLLKQLTMNSNKESEIKVWELVWMITGLFACGEILANEVKKFLQSRRTIQIARECLTRFYKILDTTPRNHPPHQIEIEAVKNNPCHIFHRVYFPDNTHKFFHINSLTTFGDLKEDILMRLKLNFSRERFHLLLQVIERLFLLPENYYVFDYLQVLKNWAERERILKTKSEYKICFMKCTDRNASTIANTNSNLKFTFSQEYIKYIQDHYNVTPDNTVELAALLYKIFSFDETAEPFQKILPKLIPSKSFNLMKTETWQKRIEERCKKCRLSSKENGKIQFLKCLRDVSSTVLPYFPIISETQNLKNYMFYSFSTSLKFADKQKNIYSN